MRFAAFAHPERKDQGPLDDLERASSRLLKEAIEGSIISQQYPKSLIEICALVLEDDGCKIIIWRSFMNVEYKTVFVGKCLLFALNGSQNIESFIS